MELTPELLGNLLQVIIVNLVLSGDNAVVIGMAAHPLPPRQRRLAIAIGGGAAIVLRVVLTAVAALLLSLPAVKLIGGVLLLWIAFQLLEEPGDSRAGARQDHLSARAAIMTILVADLIMSLDNVLGVAAASNGNVALLTFGLVVSMLIVLLGGGVFAELIDRLWWLAYVGAGVIAWTGVDMVLADGVLQGQPLVGGMSEAARLAITALVSLLVVAAAHLAHRRASPEKVGTPRRSVS